MALNRCLRFLAAVILTGTIGIALAGCGSGPSSDGLAPEGSAAGAESLSAAVGAINYEFELVGGLDSDLQPLLEGSSQLIRLQSRPPASLSGLRRRIADDIERLGKALRSEGYYDYTLTDRMSGPGTKEEPVKVTIAVEPGPRYALGSYRVAYRGAAPDLGELDVGRDLGLEIGAPAEAAAIAEAEKRLLRRHANSGYPFAKVQDERFVLNRAARTLAGTVALTAGPRVTFGPLRIVGLKAVEEGYLRRLIGWRQGALYDAGFFEETRQTLARTGLFTAVVFQPADAPDPSNQVPVTLSLAEGPRRSLGFGAGFSTDETFDVDAFWEHRNLSGEGEKLRLEAGGTSLRQEASLHYAKPNFRKLGQTLIATTTARHENSTAFKELSLNQFLGSERLLSPGLTFSSGPAFELARIDDRREAESFGLVGFPMALTYDSRDDPLDPTKGWQFGVTSAPYLGVLFEPTQFWSNEVKAAAYLSLDAEGWVVLAARATLGTIIGDSDQDIPANKRFFAGGGGSIRGYELRTVGPLDAADDPLGGLSIVELNLETRIRVTELFGIVPFIDGGQVYEDPWIEPDADLQWAAGLGLRYFSPIGPLRLDVAVPLNGRDGVDDDYEFYVSIGQAF